jgi:hypothetical protein
MAIQKLKSINNSEGEEVEIFKAGPNNYIAKIEGKSYNFKAKDKPELEKLIKYYTTSEYAVIRIEADEDHDNYDDKVDEVDDIELDPKQFEVYTDTLIKNGILKHSMYIGNAYFLETFGSDKKHINQAFKIFKEDVKDITKNGIIATKEDGYRPDWSYDDEDDDEDY